jgi:hypothetical protein
MDEIVFKDIVPAFSLMSEAIQLLTSGKTYDALVSAIKYFVK